MSTSSWSRRACRRERRTGASLLVADAPGGVQPVGFTPEEFERAWTNRSALVREAVEHGVALEGEAFFQRFGPDASSHLS
jgi:hypothetical protein